MSPKPLSQPTAFPCPAPVRPALVALAVFVALAAFVSLLLLPGLSPAPAVAAPVEEPQPEPGSSAPAVIAATMAPTPTTTTITSDSPDPSVVGQSYTVNFQVVPNAASSDNLAGTIQVSDGTGGTCSFGPATGSTTLLSGSCSLISTSAGAKTLTATFTPSNPAIFNGSSDTESHQVNKADTQTVVTFSPGSPKVCDTIYFTATVTAVSPGSGTPSSGTVTFFDGTAVLGIGTYAGSGQWTYSTASLSVGSHSITAVYGGNADYNGSTSPPVTVTVNKASSTTTVTTLAPNPSTFGDPVTLRATVTGGCGTPTGIVFFNDGGVTIGTAVLNASGVADLVAYDLVAGVHEISAVYHGNATYEESSSGIHIHTVNRRGTTTTLSSSANPSVFGQTVTFTGTVSSGIVFTPTGQVTFRDGETVIGTGTLDGSGRAVFATAALEVGSHPMTADYQGDQNFLPASGSLTQTVNRANTTTTITRSSKNPTVYGESVTFYAVVTVNSPGAGMPTGTVTFYVDGSAKFDGLLGLLGPGEVSFTATEPLDVGSRSITAIYNGDGHFNNSPTSAAFTQTVNKADTTTQIRSSLSPSVFGQEVTFTAVVGVDEPGSGSPSGDVRFYEDLDSSGTFNAGDIDFGTEPLENGQATFEKSDLSVGTHDIGAKYLGDSHFNASEETLEQEVEKANTSTFVSSSANPSVYGQVISFTAEVTVTGVASVPVEPSGTVAFKDGGTPITGCSSVPLVSGSATCTTGSLTAGTHTIVAEYSGDGNFKESSGSLSQTVNKANTTTTLTSSPAGGSAVGESVTFTAIVNPVTPGAGTPTGDVDFLDGGRVIATRSLSGGVATFTTNSLTAGTHQITADYKGDSNFNRSVSNRLAHTVSTAGSTTTLTSSQNPSVYGQNVTFQATVTSASGTPTGQVTFKDGATTLGTAPLVAGVATFSTPWLAVGTHPITAVYGGDANFAGSTGTLSPDQVVNKADTTTTITSDLPDPSVVGQPVPVSFTVVANAPGGGAPTGNVTVDDGTASCTGTVAVGTCTLTPTTAGAKTLTATYAGDSNFNGSSGTESHDVNKANTTTTVTSVPNPSLVGQAVTINATVTANPPGGGTPTGTVTFKDSATPICSNVPLVGGSASCNTSALTVGTHTLNVDYSGDGNFNASSGSTSHDVGDQPTDLSVTKTDSPDPVNAGGDLTYVVVVTNLGSFSTDVTLTDTHPPQVTFKSATPGAPTCTHSAGIITCNLGALAGGGGSATVTIVVNVPVTTPAGTVLLNTAQVTGTRPDPDLSNNTSIEETTVYRSPQFGDCNGDEAVDIGDVFSIVRRIFDPVYAGTPACDANRDEKVDAGDVPCTVLIMFDGPSACSTAERGEKQQSVVGGLRSSAAPALTMPNEIAALPGSRATVPINFSANGHSITSLAFSVDYDESRLSFDPADRDGNGVPDDLLLVLPGEFSAKVTFDADDISGELDVFIGDITPPLSSLSDGPIGVIVLDVVGSPGLVKEAVRFSLDPTASFGDTSGQSVSGTARPVGRFRVYLPTLMR